MNLRGEKHVSPGKSKYDLESQAVRTEVTILNPHAYLLQRWNKTLALSCIIAISIDPLFLYIPLIIRDQFCLSVDKKIVITACVLRSLVDIFYLFHIILQFRTAFVGRESLELIDDPKVIAKRYLCSYFIIDIFSILPLPQVVILLARYIVKWPVSDVTKEIIKAAIFIQYIPRILRIYAFYKDVTIRSSFFSEMPWSGAASNFFFYMLTSHVVGSFWYLMSVERVDTCWRRACESHQSCSFDDLYCGRGQQRDNSFLKSSCFPPQSGDSAFDYGIFLDALTIQLYQGFFRRFFYCFVWGLRNLSSLGQNLETSNGIGENLFVVVISITGLILFSFLAGNIQRYLHSLTVRADEMRLRLRDQEQWMSRDRLPELLRKRVRQHGYFKWHNYRGADKDSLIQDLPKDLRMDIKRYHCLSLLKRVPMFERILDERVLNALCYRLKPVLYCPKSYILREGDLVDEMLFINRGCVTRTINYGTGFGSGRTGLKAGDFFGEELLMWALHPNSSSTTLPISTKTFQTITSVEVFSLMPEDLKCVLAQFRYLHGNLHRHNLRSYSQEWRLWGACIIQAAWREHYRRKMGRSLKQAQDSFPRLLPQKPADYDFTSQF